MLLCYVTTTMKPLLIAMLLAVMQAPSPAPGKAADTRANGGNSVNKHAQDEKNPTTQATPLPEPAGTQHKTGDIVADDAHQAISIRDLPPVSVRRDWIDWLGLALTGALLIVGALDVRYAIKTLKGIERQANANEGQLREIQQAGEQTNKLIAQAGKQAEAALLNAQAAINSDRPWVIIFVTHQSGGYSFRAMNLGRTPAEVISFSAEFKCVSNINELPPEPAYGTEHVPTIKLLVPGDKSGDADIELLSGEKFIDLAKA